MDLRNPFAPTIGDVTEAEWKDGEFVITFDTGTIERIRFGEKCAEIIKAGLCRPRPGSVFMDLPEV